MLLAGRVNKKKESFRRRSKLLGTLLTSVGTKMILHQGRRGREEGKVTSSVRELGFYTAVQCGEL